MKNINYFLKNNFFIYGDTCSGKSYLYKKLFFKKKDIDFFLLYKNILFKNEFFFRKNEFLLFNKIFKNNVFFLGGGSICFFKKKNINTNIFFLKNVNLLIQLKRLIYDNNRPMFYCIKNLKLRFCIRKKKYIKIFNHLLNKCFFCNLKKIYEINKI